MRGLCRRGIRVRLCSREMSEAYCELSCLYVKRKMLKVVLFWESKVNIKDKMLKHDRKTRIDHLSIGVIQRLSTH